MFLLLCILKQKFKLIHQIRDPFVVKILREDFFEILWNEKITKYKKTMGK